MDRNHFLKKAVRRILAVITVVAVCLSMGVMPGIQAYADGDAGADAQAAANLRYTLTATNGDRVATTANADQTTVLIFGYVGCGKTRSTLNSVSACSWVKRPDIRVMFADVRMNDQETVSNYKEDYGCDEMVFCYDEEVGINNALNEYKKLLNITDNTIPLIILIDKNNQIQGFLQGSKTSDELLNEMKKFADIDENGTGSDTSGSGSGIENYTHSLTSIDGTKVSTKANPNETTVLMFGYTSCGKTKSTLQSVDQSDWISRSDIRVVYADDIVGYTTTSGSSLTMVQERAKDYTSGKIQFCYDKDDNNHTIAGQYLALFKLTGEGGYPYIVLIDQYNKVQSVTTGPKTADEIIAEINKFAKDDQTSGGNGEDTTEPSTPDTSEPSTPDTSEPSTPAPSPSIPSGPSTWNPPSSGSSQGSQTTQKPSTPDTSEPDKTDPVKPDETPADTPQNPDLSEPSQAVYDPVVLEDGSLQLKGSDGTVPANQLVTASDGKRYYADENGVAAVQKIVKYEDAKYFAKEDGIIAQKEFCTTQQGSTVFARADGSLAVNTIVNIGGKKYYAKANCALAKDGFFMTEKGSKIYAKASGELIVNQTFQSDGKKYYAKPSGALVISAFYTTAKGSKIYAKASGELVTDRLFRVDGSRYCAKPSGALVKNAFYTLPSGEKVYAKASGEVVENQIFTVKGKKFYADKNGKIAAKKWVTVGNKKYYCSAAYKITKVLKK